MMMLFKRFSVILFLHITLGLTAVPPINIPSSGASNPSRLKHILPPLSPTHPQFSHVPPSHPTNSTSLARTITFPVPNTRTTLIFSDIDPTAPLPGNDLFLCLTESLSSITTRTIAIPGDAVLPDGFAAYHYGRVTVTAEGHPIHMRLTYGIISDALRGIGLFMA